jgi:formylglycine-generating enzyme required for sulfatase activity
MKGTAVMKRFLIILGLSLLIAASASANTQPVVSNVMAVQRAHTALVDVTYDVADADGDLVHVTMWYSLDGGVSWDNECVTVSGDVGAGVVPGTGLSVTWDAGADAPDFIDEQFALRVYADDSSGGVPDGFVLITAGTFQMGSPTDEPGRNSSETLHTVTLTQGFYMARTEVTEEWWDAVMGSGSSTSQLPKAYVSWDDAIAFCNQLSLDEGLTPAYTINGPNGDATWNHAASGYRLPTEAEWEYACRAGSQTAFCNGPITNINCSPLDPNLDQVGWYCGNSGYVAHDVGQKTANAWGLHDMHGNLAEWVWDGYRSDYQYLPSEDPVYDVGPGAYRVFRGGHRNHDAQYCRSAYRVYYNPNDSGNSIGFRPVRSTN